MQLQVSPCTLRDLLDNIEDAQDAEYRLYWAQRISELGAPHIWMARYSAPGYLDCTDWIYSDVGPIDAARQTHAIYGDSEPGSDDRRELAQIIWQARALGYRS